jgi:hypothetical protein
MTIPSFGARTILLDNDDSRSIATNTPPVPEKNVEGWIRSLKRSLAWREMSSTMDNLVLAGLTQSQLVANRPELAKKELEEASLWQTLSLARSPANAYGWARLAYMQIQTEGITPSAASMLQLSLKTGPYEPSLALSRLSMAMMLFNYLDDATKAVLPSLIRLAWNEDPEQLAQAAKRGNFVSMVEQSLRNDPADLDSFRNLLASEEPATSENID